MRNIVLSCAVAAIVGCAPSINPQMKAATDNMLAQFGKGGHTEAEPSSYEPMSWEPGQWVAFKTTTGKGKDQQVSFTRISVVERTDEGIWVETENQTYQNKSLSKILYSQVPNTPEQAMDVVKKMVTKTDDQEVQVMDFTQPNPMMDMMKGMMGQYMSAAVAPENVNLEGKANVTTAGGSFEGCGQYTSQISVPGKSYTMRWWYHPAIPVNGGVKAESTDGEYTMEVLDYGTAGATSQLPTP